MSVAQRMGRETAAQVLGLVIIAADRLVVAGTLVRIWNIDEFSRYALAVAAAGLVTLVDFGCNLYFANRLLFLVQQHRVDAARRMLGAGNAAMLGVTTLGVVVVLAGLALLGTGTAHLPLTASLFTAAAALALAVFSRNIFSVQLSVYRAHDQFARQTLLLLAVDTLRIVLTLAVVMAGGGLLAVALAQLAVAVLGHAWIVFVDARRRFPQFCFAIGGLDAAERPDALRTSLGLWLQSAPSTAIAYFPVFLMGAASATALQVAQFVLMRTVGNFARTGLQPFSVVFAQEAARRHAIGDPAGLSKAFRESTAVLGVLGAVLGGALGLLGAPLFALWTGKSALYSAPMLWLAIATPLLFPTLAMAQAYLVTVNRPWPLAQGRALQIVLTMAMFVLMPVADPALRMMIALALAEVLGLGIPVTTAIVRGVPGAGIAMHLDVSARLFVSLALTGGAGWIAVAVFPTRPLPAVALGMVLTALAGGVSLIVFGLRGERRTQVLTALLGRVSGRRAR